MSGLEFLAKIGHMSPPEPRLELEKLRLETAGLRHWWSHLAFAQAAVALIAAVITGILAYANGWFDEAAVRRVVGSVRHFFANKRNAERVTVQVRNWCCRDIDGDSLAKMLI